MRKLAAVLSMAVVCALVPAASSARTGDCEQVMLRSWNVKIDVAKKVYRVGDEAALTLTVTRKKADMPVADATTAVVLTNRDDQAVFAWGTTDAQGIAQVQVRLKKREIGPGPVKLFAYTYHKPVDTVCASVVEYGYKQVAQAFRVKR